MTEPIERVGLAQGSNKPQHGTSPWPLRRVYPLIGSVLALGAPAGLLIARCIQAGVLPTPAWMLAEISSSQLTYGYLAAATTAVFVALGYLLGSEGDRLRSLSLTDELTGLHNRRYLHARLSEELRRAQRYGSPLALLLVDVDRLKLINDTTGHAAGDEALQTVAGVLRENLRTTDVAARDGGDEFAVLLPHTTAGEATTLAYRIRTNGRLRTAAVGAPLTLSIGVADLHAAEISWPKDLVAAADRALYEAKSAGRNRAVLARRPRRAQAPAAAKTSAPLFARLPSEEVPHAQRS